MHICAKCSGPLSRKNYMFCNGCRLDNALTHDLEALERLNHKRDWIVILVLTTVFTGLSGWWIVYVVYGTLVILPY